jgi:hypothetical protein
MENKDNNGIIVKKKTSEAMLAAQKRYYNKKKENAEFQERRRAYFRKHYENNKEKVIERVRNYQRNIAEIEQLERLYELQQEGLIDLYTGDMSEEEYEKYNERLLNKLSHVHLST